MAAGAVSVAATVAAVAQHLPFVVVLIFFLSLAEVMLAVLRTASPGPQTAHSKKPMRVLITGASGYIASHVIEHLNTKWPASKQLEIWASGYPHTVISNPAVRSFSNARIELTSKKMIQQAIRAFKPDLVIHFAAMAAVRTCELNPSLSMKVNADSIRILGKALRQVSPNAGLVSLSTDWVYGSSSHASNQENIKRSGPDDMKTSAWACSSAGESPSHQCNGFREEDVVIHDVECERSTDRNSFCNVPHGFGVYGKSKYLGEVAASEELKSHALILRCALVFGGASPTNPRLRSTLGWMVDEIRARLSRNPSAIGRTARVALFSDELRSAVYIEDVAAVIFALLERKHAHWMTTPGYSDWSWRSLLGMPNKARRLEKNRPCPGSNDAAECHRALVMNMGGPEVISRYEMGVEIAKGLGSTDYESVIEPVPTPETVARPRFLAMNSSLLFETTFPEIKRTSFASGVSQALPSLLDLPQPKK